MKRVMFLAVLVLAALPGCAALGLDPAIPKEGCKYANAICDGLDPAVPPADVVAAVDSAIGLPYIGTACEWLKLFCNAAPGQPVPPPPTVIVERVHAARAQGMIR